MSPSLMTLNKIDRSTLKYTLKYRKLCREGQRGNGVGRVRGDRRQIEKQRYSR